MPRRRLGLSLAVALGLGVVGLSVGGSSPPSVQHLRLQPIAATTNHAAVVIDTGQEVKKFCLAFPEDEISGAEALRRVDAQVQFANFGTRGQAVCSLCGTGCPSSNCFCDPNRFWAYHRAGPGGAPYAFSRVGASSTTVRNGDVEGWKWGAGEAPPAAKVSEVCNIDEPPARSTSAPASTSTSTSTTPDSQPPATTTPSTVVGVPAASGGSSGATTTTSTAPSSGPGTPGAAPVGATPGTPVQDNPLEPGAPVEAAPSVPDDELSAPTGESLDPGPDGSTAAAAPRRDEPESVSSSSRGTVAVFVALLGGVLAWRARLRRAKVRPEGSVR